MHLKVRLTSLCQGDGGPAKRYAKAEPDTTYMTVRQF